MKDQHTTSIPHQPLYPLYAHDNKIMSLSFLVQLKPKIECKRLRALIQKRIENRIPRPKSIGIECVNGPGHPLSIHQG